MGGLRRLVAVCFLYSFNSSEMVGPKDRSVVVRINQNDCDQRDRAHADYGHRT